MTVLWQEYIEAKNKSEFILKCISDFQNSSWYQKAITAEKYYAGDTDILTRKKFYWNEDGGVSEDYWKANNKIPSEKYAMLIKQRVQYLLSNGLKIKSEYKEKISEDFEVAQQRIATQACNAGVGWGLVSFTEDNLLTLTPISSLEFIPLIDELTSEIVAGIRFFQTKENRPLFIEFYEKDGVTIFEKKDRKTLAEYKAKTAYFQTIKKSKVEKTGKIVSIDNYEQLPIIALKSNVKGESELTNSRKATIDLIDIILSDFGNNLQDSEDVYWVLKNYEGEDIAEFLGSYKRYKTIKIGEDGEAKKEVTEVPYEARRIALEILNQQLTDNMMGLDIRDIKGGSITNEVIKAMYANLDLAVDELEYQMIEFINNIMKIFKKKNNITEKVNFGFIRNRIINISQTIEDIYTFRSDIDIETALQLNPMIAEEEIPDILERLDSEKMAGVSLLDTTQVDVNSNNVETETGEVEEAEEIAGKSLNGAQTQSLLAVINQFAAGQLSEGQAINIISVAIGISKEKAREILNGLS